MHYLNKECPGVRVGINTQFDLILLWQVLYFHVHEYSYNKSQGKGEKKEKKIIFMDHLP